MRSIVAVTGPAWPGVNATSAIALVPWRCTEAGMARASIAARARGGGVKRQSAATEKIARTSTTSTHDRTRETAAGAGDPALIGGGQSEAVQRGKGEQPDD